MSYTPFEAKQGTEEWKAERMKRVTASQTPCLLGVTPSGYQKPIALLLEKITGKEEPIDEYKQILFNRGHEAEVVAREWVEGRFGITFPAMTLISTAEPDLMASLDGFNEKEKIVFEAKWMGNKKIEEIRAGEQIPEHHFCQIQAQLWVSQAKHCIYFATDGIDASVMTDIYPDPSYQSKILNAVKEFMGFYRTFEHRWPFKKVRKNAKNI